MGELEQVTFNEVACVLLVGQFAYPISSEINVLPVCMLVLHINTYLYSLLPVLLCLPVVPRQRFTAM